MGQALRASILLAALLGCGSPPELPAGFLNHTQHSDAELWTIWRSAQRNLTLQIDLNPLQRSSDASASANLLPGDARALRVEPHQIEVGSEPDVSASALYSATGVQRPDPTGLIACPQPCNVRYAAAYSRYSGAVTKYAASWEFQGSNFELILRYEFENHILTQLGYDMRWR